MDWNQYRSSHKQKNGTTSIEKLSSDYQKYKKTLKSPRKSPNYKKILASLPESRVAQRKNLEKVMKNEGGRGSATRAWRGSSPQPGTERHQLKKVCGDKAFLDPEHEKFPVMAALRVNDKCEYDCRGLTASKNRSCQYNHLDIAAKAQKLGVKECGWNATKSPCRNKRQAPGPM